MKRVLMKIMCLLALFSCVTAVAQVQVGEQNFVVSQDGTGDFKTIQAAVNAVRDHSEMRAMIRIKAGTYREKLVIPSWKKNIALIGDDKANTIITGADFSGKDFPGGDFTGNLKYSTYTSYTVLVQANDCLLRNLTIENTAGRVGQAVALATESDRLEVIDCKLLGNQDTLYTAKSGRNYFKSCFIAGTTDFIFGEATALFEQCTIKSLADSYITAASTTKHQQFGYVFLDCKLIAAAEVTKVFLGRPWRPYAKTVFINTTMDKHIVKEGWDPWKGDNMFPEKEKTTFYAEYNSSGEGGNMANRVNWAMQLSEQDVKKYTLQNIFGDWSPSGR
ncbi:pectinesterase family protein [Dyadobacter pollutisoli]|uniref:Pectinesterase n=1 Tax=Dyadobacter pollutisoli TaxID=2910158 RepID=A0A9E8SRF0_9BACT|nr:pectinesterase family protein [Dyadobacter pollutisoli]WAC14102.1 pectinesterase family protein [Dyadobacter pollutisoli]